MGGDIGAHHLVEAVAGATDAIIVYSFEPFRMLSPGMAGSSSSDLGSKKYSGNRFDT